jgi:hypothetical protein
MGFSNIRSNKALLIAAQAISGSLIGAGTGWTASKARQDGRTNRDVAIGAIGGTLSGGVLAAGIGIAGTGIGFLQRRGLRDRRSGAKRPQR